jgi:hypothetical protein
MEGIVKLLLLFLLQGGFFEGQSAQLNLGYGLPGGELSETIRSGSQLVVVFSLGGTEYLRVGLAADFGEFSGLGSGRSRISWAGAGPNLQISPTVLLGWDALWMDLSLIRATLTRRMGEGKESEGVWTAGVRPFLKLYGRRNAALFLYGSYAAMLGKERSLGYFGLGVGVWLGLR